MYILTNSNLHPKVIAEGIINANTLYLVLCYGPSKGQVDVSYDTSYYLSPEYYTVVNFKDYMKLCT